MALSAFDLYSVGIGPSSSHTVGPMRAARMFATDLRDAGLAARVAHVRAELFGSLGATGSGHGTPRAVVLGLEGEDPATTDIDAAATRLDRLRRETRIRLVGTSGIDFDLDRDLVLHRGRTLPAHPNGMTFTAHDRDGRLVKSCTYYSIGGGFVADEVTIADGQSGPGTHVLRSPFSTAAELLRICAEEERCISDVMLANELAWRSEEEVRAGMLAVWRAMADCVGRGMRGDGLLPGGLRVRRRAAALHDDLRARPTDDPLLVMDWVNLFALAVNEENAAGGRVVTAPTNGAAGIIPAVLHYYVRFVPGADEDGILRFLLTAAAIGIIIKTNASISGAEVGCQGEIGSACAMAAAGLAEVLGGTPAQVENAAEVGLEHNLGLTCDPVGGLVQIPCIERNAIASMKAINAARLALRGDGSHSVSLDQVVQTMRQTGRDMSAKYKETSLGGLAVTVVEC